MTDDDALDMNMGEKILVRLRPHFDPDTFLPEESIVGTMLHEVRTFYYSQPTPPKFKIELLINSSSKNLLFFYS